ncbi:hypothetical protein [Microbispora sp. GKU 823]|uniref:hypothetical protein n=1 Tax=Microbispora sp. GKU 823 TaxID=1652100 RepID=UPI0009A38B5F|nr:hypothetical protein [Microbispora sp. GKU 823]OPG01970.1 hypothetical protein B1L11_43460 [Microbispora sp. GKU 823]
MGLMPPDWAQPVASLVNFPKIDEADIRTEIRPWQIVHSGAASGGTGAEDEVRRLPGVYQGVSAGAMQNNWNKTGTTEHLRAAVGAAAYAPAVLEGTASAVTATKVAVITQAVAGATRLASVLVAGGPFAAASATAGLLATRYAMRKILREAEEGAPGFWPRPSRGTSPNRWNASSRTPVARSEAARPWRVRAAPTFPCGARPCVRRVRRGPAAASSWTWGGAASPIPGRAAPSCPRRSRPRWTRRRPVSHMTERPHERPSRR